MASRDARASTRTRGVAVGPLPSAPDTSSSSSVPTTQRSDPDPQPSTETSVGTPIDIQDPGVDSASVCDSEDGTFDDERAQEKFDDFVLSLPIDDRHMLAVLLMESFRTRQKMRVVDAAREAGSIVGYNDKTVRALKKQFFENQGELKERKQGKYERVIVSHDEEVNKRAAEWVRANAFVKGRPNMTA